MIFLVRPLRGGSTIILLKSGFILDIAVLASLITNWVLFKSLTRALNKALIMALGTTSIPNTF